MYGNVTNSTVSSLLINRNATRTIADGTTGPLRCFRAKIQCDSMTMRSLFALLLAAVGMTG
jgi:hypothetical protein